MSKLIIKKRVSLDFLGDEYKDASITFRSMPIPDYEVIASEIKNVKDGEANKAILEIVKRYYVSAEFPNDDGVLEPLDSKDELDQMDADMLIECFGRLTGRDIKGLIEKQEELANQGAPKEVIEGIEVTPDPKSSDQSKPG